ncbi:class I SAM-dependent methyltransferase [Psychrobacillus sp. NPDC058041]|uniref:class I SAM-dependent methyltransferase n=1 Tax=Psychrobacillus sp. NPDC058041 TaxID=3346310 RepID=UPI0036D940D0
MDNTKKFNGKAAIYAKARPSYAPELINHLSYIGIAKDSFVADIGSGTGIFSKTLLEMGCNVYGVEPSEDMRSESKENLGQFATFYPVNGTAEHTTLQAKSVDFITVAQAFHWFDTVRFKMECSRILHDKGKVILVWNSRVMDSPLVQENEQIFRRFCPDFKGFSGGIGYMDEKIKTFFCNFDVHRFQNDLQFNKSKFIERNLSASYSLKENDVEYDSYIKQLNNLFDKYAIDGMLIVPNETIAYIGQI